MVADAGELDPERVQRLDRRLVGVRVHLERPAGEVVTVGEEDRVPVAGPDALEVSRQVRRPADGDRLAVGTGDGAAVCHGRRTQVAVEVRDRHQLHWHSGGLLSCCDGWLLGSGSRGTAGRGQGERCQGEGGERGERSRAGQTAHKCLLLGDGKHLPASISLAQNERHVTTKRQIQEHGRNLPNPRCPLAERRAGM